MGLLQTAVGSFFLRRLGGIIFFVICALAFSVWNRLLIVDRQRRVFSREASLQPLPLLENNVMKVFFAGEKGWLSCGRATYKARFFSICFPAGGAGSRLIPLDLPFRWSKSLDFD